MKTLSIVIAASALVASGCASKVGDKCKDPSKTVASNCTASSDTSTTAPSSSVSTTTSYQVTPSADAHTTVSPTAVQTVVSGKTTAFKLTAASGYTLATAVTGTCAAGTWSGATYTTGAITANCTVGFSSTITADLAITNKAISTTSLVLGAATSQVKLSWNAATDPATAASKITYQVCVSSADPDYDSFATVSQVTGGTCTKQTGTTTATLTVANDHVYLFNVVASNGKTSLAYAAKAEILKQSLIDYYPFEGNTKDIVTASANDLVASSYGGTTAGVGTNGSDRFSLADAAYDFSATNTDKCLSTTNNMDASVVGTNPRSVSFWMNVTNTTTAPGPFAIGQNALAQGDHFGIYASIGSDWNFWFWGDDAAMTESYSATAGWQHWVITYSGGAGTIGTMIAYVDGVQVSSSTTLSNAVIPNTRTQPMQVGCVIDGNLGGPFSRKNFLSGSLDDFRVFNNVLSASEIANLYKASKP